MAIDSARAVHFLKFSGTDLKIVWHMQKTVDNNVDDIPTMIAMDTNNLREFYLFGKMKLVSAGASVSLGLRVNKLDGKLLHQVHFKDQDELGGYYHPTGTNQFVGCGTNLINKNIFYWKITSDGSPLFSRKYTVVVSSGDTKCKGVNYDYAKGQGAILVVSPASSMKTVNTYTKDTDTGA